MRPGAVQRFLSMAMSVALVMGLVPVPALAEVSAKERPVAMALDDGPAAAASAEEGDPKAETAAFGQEQPADGAKAEPGVFPADARLSVEQPIREQGDVVMDASATSSWHTIEFTYGEKHYSLSDFDSVVLADVLERVGITGDPTAVEVSNSELLSASYEGGAWVITMLQAFGTEEWVKVTIDGVEYTIFVTSYESELNTLYVGLDGKGMSQQAMKLLSNAGPLTNRWYFVASVDDYGETNVENLNIPDAAASVVNIILADGAVLRTNGITMAEGKTLRIWAQRGDGQGGLGQLKTSKYGIRVQEGRTLEINGGIINASTNSNEGNHAGIGGNSGHSAGTITINRGTVTARAVGSAAGIGGGGGSGGAGGDITINGGEVTAYGGSGGAGIGGGGNCSGGNITINGGTVNAIAGSNGAGIGSGNGGGASTIRISGGEVFAKGGSRGSGIGGGYNAPGGNITIENGANVWAVGGMVPPGYVAGQDYSGVGADLEASPASNQSYAIGDGADYSNGTAFDIYVPSLVTVGWVDPAAADSSSGYAPVQGSEFWTVVAGDSNKTGAENLMLTHNYAAIQAQPAGKATVVFYANGGKGEMQPQMAPRGEAVPLNANAFTYADHHFVGWNTDSNGKGISYGDGEEVIAADLTLYAQWEHDPVIHYGGGNGDSWEDVHADVVGYGQDVTLRTAPAPVNEKYVSYWANRDDRDTVYRANMIPSVTKDVYLYAVAEEKEGGTAPTYVGVIYRPNGGEGSARIDSVRTDDASYKEYKLAGADTFTREGYVLTGWKVEGDEDATYELGVEPFASDATAPTKNLKLLAQWEEVPAAQVLGHSLTLDGRIGMNTYLVLGDEILANKDSYRVEYWDGSMLVAAIKVSDARRETKKVDGKDYEAYGFTVTSVAKDADTRFVMKIRNESSGACIDFANSDRSLVSGGVGLAYSIVDYLEDRIANSASPEMVQLAKDIKAYHVYAKHYFAVRDQGAADALPSVADFQPVAAADLEAYKHTAPENIDRFTYEGTTLDLLSDTSFRLYFETDDVSKLTFTCGGAAMAPVKNGNMYYVEVAGIAAPDLDKMYDITVSNGLETTTAHHGPLGYALWALSTDAAGDPQREALQRTMMALYRYNQSAKAYFSAVQEG